MYTAGHRCFRRTGPQVQTSSAAASRAADDGCGQQLHEGGLRTGLKSAHRHLDDQHLFPFSRPQATMAMARVVFVLLLASLASYGYAAAAGPSRRLLGASDISKGHQGLISRLRKMLQFLPGPFPLPPCTGPGCPPCQGPGCPQPRPGELVCAVLKIGVRHVVAGCRSLRLLGCTRYRRRRCRCR